MKIDRNNVIFQNPSFIKDKYKFNVFYDMFGSNEQLFYSDSETYIIGRGNVGYPIWIWTIDNIPINKVKEMEEILQTVYFLQGINEITCKKELYEQLKIDFPNATDYHEIGFLTCKKTIPMNLAYGYLDRPNYGDKTLLARYWIENCEEIYKGKEMSFQNSLEEVSFWIDSETFYVWRNPVGKAVSIASVDQIDQAGRISHVFTPMDERKRGYCKSLIYEITNELLKNQRIPILYTDHEYKVSNHMYKKIGYEEECILACIKIQK